MSEPIFDPHAPRDRAPLDARQPSSAQRVAAGVAAAAVGLANPGIGQSRDAHHLLPTPQAIVQQGEMPSQASQLPDGTSVTIPGDAPKAPEQQDQGHGLETSDTSSTPKQDSHQKEQGGASHDTDKTGEKPTSQLGDPPLGNAQT